MSTLDITLLLNGVDRGTGRGARVSRDVGGDRPDSPLRMVLVEGEALRLPPSRLRLSVLAGTAWVTQSGSDILLQAGASHELPGAADRAVISAVGTEPLFFEVR